jgi:hypothetical protein
MSELRFKIMPRYINGVDKAPETARKTDKVYIQHEQYIEGDGIVYVTGAEEQDILLNDPSVLAVVDKLTLADEIVSAAVEGIL